MVIKRDIESELPPAAEQMRRQAIVARMLAERGQRQQVSSDEIKRMREDGRH